MIALWFLVAALLPRGIALPAIRWKMQPAARPGGVDRHFKRLRRLPSSGPAAANATNANS